MFNLVVLTGRLTANPELRTTTNGIPVTTFAIAVDRKKKSGEDKQTDFINIVAYRTTAEFITKYFSKGNMIGIEGSIQTRRYQDKHGNNRTNFEVVASEAQFVETKKDTTLSGTPEAPSFSKPNANDFADLGGVSDDDLAF